MKAQVLFERILRDSGFNITKARTLVFELLSSANEPWTMHQLIEASKNGADRVSVYRTIELFEKLGIAQRINIGWKYKIELSEAFLDHHHHMTCLTCGRVVTVQDEPQFEAMIARLGRANGFTVKSHQLEMQGYCSTCQPDAI
jgi:Fur family transcriptional regulator, ferric uptake regulator